MASRRKKVAGTLILGASSGKQAMEQGRVRLVCVGLFFLLCYLTLAVRVIELSLPGEGAWRFADKGVTGMDGEIPLLSLIRQDKAAISKLLASVEDNTGHADVVLPRADITDRNGMILATSLETASLYADTRDIRNAKEAARELKKALPDLNAALTEKRLASGRSFVWIKRNLTPREQQRVMNLGIPGIHFQTEYARVYPQGKLLCHVLGFVGLDNKGLAGIEKHFDERLRAQAQGPGLALALDLRVQHIVEDNLKRAVTEFRAIGATGIVAHIPTGEILALSNLPEFDPHHPGRAKPEELFNRASLGAYEMGSTFKTFTTAMGLEQGIGYDDGYDATQPLRVANFIINDSHPQARWLSLPEIFVYSSNIGTARMALDVGSRRQQQFLRELGMFDPVAIELPERARPLIPSPWRDINTMTVAYGHGISVSPLHLVQGMAAVVNDGNLELLTLVKDGNAGKEPLRQVMSAENSKKIRRLLRAVVQYGTGRQSEVAGYGVGGKTGTAEKVKGGSYQEKAMLASFISVFPWDKPEYLVLVMIDEPKGNRSTYGYATGGWVSAPVAARIIGQMGPLLGIAPAFAEEPDDMDARWARILEMEKQRAEDKVHVAAFGTR